LIERKLADGNRDGIAYDYMACAAMIAFAFEANLNFMGYKVIKDWDEWQNWDAKVFSVLKRLEMPVVWTERPLSSMRVMKDMVALGREIEVQVKRCRGTQEANKNAIRGLLDQIDREPHAVSPIVGYCLPFELFAATMRAINIVAGPRQRTSLTPS
jgi:hypothetical protein